MGNFIEALELGADTLVMGGGIGPCRFGYYAQVQRDILKSLGYEFTMVVIEPPLGHAREVLAAARVLKGDNSWWTLARAIYLALVKLQACDEIHRAGLKLRPRVRDRARFGEIYRRSLRDIDEAASFAQVRKVTRAGLAEMHSLPQSDLHPPKVALVGEVYLLAEPAANLHIEERLGHLGVEVVRHVWISEWLKVNIFLDFLRLRRRESAEKSPGPISAACRRPRPAFGGNPQSGPRGNGWGHPRLPLYLHPGDRGPGHNAQDRRPAPPAPGLLFHG